MGLAASQARLLSLTSRIHDVEFEAQQIQSKKLQLALLEDDALKEYNEALDAQTLTFADTKGNRIAATFENLCGIGSIHNNIGTNAHYIFRDRGDRLIVPSDIYEGYDKNVKDPYKFAMYMMGITNLSETNSDYTTAIDGLRKKENVSKMYDELATSILTTVYMDSSSNYDTQTGNKIYTTKDEVLNAFKSEGSNGVLHNFVNEFISSLEGNDPTIRTRFQKDSTKPLSNDDLEAIETKFQKYEYTMYKNNGAEAVFEACGVDFDQDTFDYYVHWGQIIQMEGGIDFCTYDVELEKDPELLNQNLISGFISIEKVYSKNGTISEEATSASSDSNISFVNTSSIDSTALKKAEATYDKKLRDIQKIDKKYDLNLNRLETERTALTTEYDSVKKVISDNIERTFGIFS